MRYAYIVGKSGRDFMSIIVSKVIEAHTIGSTKVEWIVHHCVLDLTPQDNASTCMQIEPAMAHQLFNE